MDGLEAALAAARAGDAAAAKGHMAALCRSDDEALDVLEALAAGDVQYAASILEDMLEDERPAPVRWDMSHLNLRGSADV